MRCRWNAEARDYLTEDGDPCRLDDYGDRTYHCTARRRCSNHVGPRELTCHGCISSVRTTLGRILDLLALTGPTAVASGRVDRGAADQAGPVAHPVTHWWRRINERRAIEAADLTGDSWYRAHAALAAEENDDAAALLATWTAMLTEDYGHELPDQMGATWAGGYLNRHLTRVAQDPEQDFPLLKRELEACASRLEVEVRDSSKPERGVPCPICVDERKGAPRLVRHYGHWCDDESCEKAHYGDDTDDVWRCPRNRDHEWSHERYENHVRPRDTNRATAASR